MPLWIETIVLMLIAHALGLAAGWMKWGARRD